MVTDDIRGYTVRDGRDALQGTCTGVIPPIAATATDLTLTECDAQDAIDMVHGSRWDALTRDFWWRGVTMSRTRYNGSQRQMCLCCEAAPSSFLHTVTDCAVWGMLWRWAQTMSAWVGKPLPATTRRPEWFAFGAGIRNAAETAWSPAHDVAVTIWGAALYAVRVVTANLLRDCTPARPLVAVRIAQARIRRAAATELWWVRNRDAWIRDGGNDARSAPGTAAAWAAKWSRLLRLRRASSHPEGFDLAPGSPLTPGWPRVDAADRQTGG